MSREHSQQFVKAIGSDECGLLLTPFLNLDVVVTPLDIYLGEVLCPFQHVNEGRNQGERIGILDCMLIEMSIVLERVKPSVLFLNKEERRGLRQLRFSDFARLEVLINDFLKSVHLLWVEQIHLSHLGDKGVFEMYCVVKGPLRRELSCFGFLEHLGIPGIVYRKFLFNLFCGLSQGHGEGELPQGGVVFSKYPPSYGP